MKTLRRVLRNNPVSEKAVSIIRHRNVVDFPELGISVPAGRDDIIIDCGANVGDMTSRFARTGATVHAFEPNPLCFAFLTRRFAMFPNVICHHNGVMDKVCTLRLDTPETHDQFDQIDVTVSASFVNRSYGDAVKSVDVKCIDFSDFIAGLEKPVTLLKMDIEGAEVAVLNRLLDRGLFDRIGQAVVETHERFSEDLAQATRALAQRIEAAGLKERIRLDWI